MLCSCQSGIKKRATLPLASWLLSAAAISLSQPSYAEPSQEMLVPNLPIEWVTGPAQVRLGTLGSLQVPDGYKFTDSKGAKDELAQLKVVVPQGLLAILESTPGGSCVTLQFSNVGYVADNAKDPLDTAAMLKSASERLQKQNTDRSSLGLPPLSAIDWDLKPVSDPSKHSLEWAFRADAHSDRFILHTVRLFARHGVLDLATFRSAKSSSQADSLKDIAKAISFQAGEGYADFAAGDKIAAIGLTDLVLNSSSSNPKTAIGSVFTMANQMNLWLAGVGIFVLAAGGILLVKRSRGLKPVNASDSSLAPSRAVAAPIAAKPLALNHAPASSKPRTMSQLALNKAAGLSKPVNGNNNNHDNNHNHGSRRKKVFDYNRYFTDLMSAVSSQANQADVYQTNGQSLENGRLPSTPESLDAAAAPANNQSTEMITQQKALIEEQKHLIQEQSKLIEEKSRLIAEKNQLLKMQADFMDGKLL